MLFAKPHPDRRTAACPLDPEKNIHFMLDPADKPRYDDPGGILDIHKTGSTGI